MSGLIQPSLFFRLFPESNPSQDHGVLGLAAHIQGLLNAKQIALGLLHPQAHALCELVHQIPRSTPLITRQIREIIRGFEPRLQQVRVLAQSPFRFELRAHLTQAPDTPLHLEIELESSGRFLVRAGHELF